MPSRRRSSRLLATDREGRGSPPGPRPTPTQRSSVPMGSNPALAAPSLAELDTRAAAARGRRRPARGAWSGVGFVVPLVAYLVVLYGAPLYENASLSLHRYTRATFVTGDAPFTGLA